MLDTPPDSEADRTAVPAELQKNLLLYRRLWLARIDLDEAQATVKELQEKKLPIPRRKLPSPLLLSLTTAMVVAYARPFIDSRGHTKVAARVVPGSLLRVLTSRQRELHDYLIQIRNREVAHTDADYLDLSLRLFPDGDSGILRSMREPFRQSDLRAISRNIEKLSHAIERNCEELRQKLPHGVWI